MTKLMGSKSINVINAGAAIYSCEAFITWDRGSAPYHLGHCTGHAGRNRPRFASALDRGRHSGHHLDHRACFESSVSNLQGARSGETTGSTSPVVLFVFQAIVEQVSLLRF